MNLLIFTIGLLLGSFITFAVAYWLQKRYEKKLKQAVDQLPRWSYDPTASKKENLNSISKLFNKCSELEPPTEKPFNE